MGMFDLGKNVVEEKEVDSLGGKGPLSSGIYDFIIKLAYITKSKGGAMAVNLDLAVGAQTVKQTIYISSGDAKGNKFSYTDKEGNEKALPGYSQINNLCLLACGKKLNELDPENKTVNLYNYETKKEVPTEVPMLMELIDQDITAGVLKIIKAKQEKDALNNYVDVYKEGNLVTQEANEIDKWFRTRDRMTVAEILAEATESVFADKWATDKTSKLFNEKKKIIEDASVITGSASSGTTASAGTQATAASTESPKPTKSLFG